MEEIERLFRTIVRIICGCCTICGTELIQFGYMSGTPVCPRAMRGDCVPY